MKLDVLGSVVNVILQASIMPYFANPFGIYSYVCISLRLRCHAHGPLAKRLVHMAHLSGNTSGVSKSSSDWLNYTGFPGDVCVAFFKFPPGNKDAIVPNPSRKKKAIVFTNVMANAYQSQLNAGFSKVCEIFKVCGIGSLKYIREFHTLVGYSGDISAPRNVMLNETICDWLLDMSVKRPHGWDLANESSHIFQTFNHQSEGISTRDYVCINPDANGQVPFNYVNIAFLLR